jgi:8-oxo-dGTP pyrophosphatase MutT (NUDIX family)
MSGRTSRHINEEPTDMTAISYGVIVLDAQGRILLAHATQTSHWDIPKGAADDGETPIAAALRELQEETGVTLASDRLVDLGMHRYQPRKDLHLFAARARPGEIDIDACVCTSLFPSLRNGEPIPEMDAFRWVAPDSVADYVSASLARLFGRTVSLPALHATLDQA